MKNEDLQILISISISTCALNRCGEVKAEAWRSTEKQKGKGRGRGKRKRKRKREEEKQKVNTKYHNLTELNLEH